MRQTATSWRIVWVALAGLCFTGALVMPRITRGQPSSEIAQQRTRFHGDWRLAVPQQRGREVIHQAIERVVARMNFFIRGVARGRLRESTPVNGRIELLFRDSSAPAITVRYDGRQSRSYTGPVGRTVRLQTPDGDEMRLTHRFREGRLEQIFETDQGTRWNVYESTGQGQLRVSATINGTLLPQPVRFTLDYQRAR